ncbi:MAG TPA: ABC transporter substrate-binding protein, partial [Methylobacter sp.]
MKLFNVNAARVRNQFMLRPFVSLAILLVLALPLAAHSETGVSNNKILLGQSAAFTGPSSAFGTEMRLGAQTYFAYINSLGGIHGRQIELRSLDDGDEPARTEANTKKLIETDGVFALFGYVGAATSTTALPIFTEAEVPFFGAFTGVESLRRLNRFVFNIRASDFDETEKIVDQLVRIGIKRIAVFYQNDAYGTAGLAGVEKAMSKRDLKIFASAAAARNSSDVAAAVNTILSAKPDTIIMISSYQSCAEFVRQARKVVSASQFYSVSSVGSMALAEKLGAESAGIAMSQVVPLPLSPSVPVVKEYQQLMAKAGNMDFTFTSLEGF